MIERCPVFVFHLILAGSPSGEIPQTHLQSSTRLAEGKGKERERDGEREREMGVGSLWLILLVWESRAPNTGWPGFSNEFDSSLCLLSLTGDQDCIITSCKHTHTHARTHTHTDTHTHARTHTQTHTHINTHSVIVKRCLNK